jgi:predicted membrane chloride channel (bestrophin family)
MHCNMNVTFYSFVIPYIQYVLNLHFKIGVFWDMISYTFVDVTRL